MLRIGVEDSAKDRGRGQCSGKGYKIVLRIGVEDSAKDRGRGQC